MKLSILIPALRNRRKMRKELEAVLLPQVESHRDVELLIEEDVGRLPSGEKRNRLVRRSAGEYFSFVDDDDLVAGDYVRRVREGCLSGAAVVSFWVERIGSDRPRQIHEFSIRHRDQQRLSNGNLGMAANHLCAWRRDVGTAVAFPPHLGYNDDLFWYMPLLESGLVKTERHLPRVLYTYRYDSSGTVNQRREAVRRTHRWAAGGVDCFRLPDGRIVVAVAGRRHTVGQSTVRVRDQNNHVHDLPRHELRPFCTVQAR
ncbi:MAG: glycosyltransferase [Planctomycetota bacterium]